MSHRLQVLLEETEIEEIRRVARRHRMSVAEWVRQALRAARRNEPLIDSASKLEAVRRAARYRFAATTTPPQPGHLPDNEGTEPKP